MFGRFCENILFLLNKLKKKEEKIWKDENKISESKMYITHLIQKH